MSDKDYLLEMLTTEKNISVNLVYALNEASNKNIYDLYFKMFKSINKITKDIYEECVNKVFNDLAKRYEDRQGGYTRIIKTEERRGDNALMVILKLV